MTTIKKKQFRFTTSTDEKFEVGETILFPIKGEHGDGEIEITFEEDVDEGGEYDVIIQYLSDKSYELAKDALKKYSDSLDPNTADKRKDILQAMKFIRKARDLQPENERLEKIEQLIKVAKWVITGQYAGKRKISKKKKSKRKTYKRNRNKRSKRIKKSRRSFIKKTRTKKSKNKRMITN